MSSVGRSRTAAIYLLHDTYIWLSCEQSHVYHHYTDLSPCVFTFPTLQCVWQAVMESGLKPDMDC